MAGPVQPPRPPYGPPPWPINQPPQPGGYPCLYPGGYSYPYPGAYPPPPNPRRGEYVIAMLLWAVPAAVLPLFWFFSLFAMMGTDVCGGDPDPCQYGFIYGAYGVGWVGAAVAAIASFLAIHRAKKKGRPALPWALAGAAAMVGCVAGWYLLYRAGLP